MRTLTTLILTGLLYTACLSDRPRVEPDAGVEQVYTPNDSDNGEVNGGDTYVPPAEGEGEIIPLGEGEGEPILPGEGEGEIIIPGEGEGEGEMTTFPGEGEGEGEMTTFPGEGEGEGEPFCRLGNTVATYEGPQETLDVGVCQALLEECVLVDGVLQYVQVQEQVLPSDEVCNLVDDDCDGVVDEGFNVGEACGDACSGEGIIACLDGEAYCDVPRGVNRLYNAGFEQGPGDDDEPIPCWTVIQGNPVVVERHQGGNTYPVCEGDYAVRPLEGDGDTYEIRQRVSLLDLAREVDAGRVEVNLSYVTVSDGDGLLAGYNILDGEGNVLSSRYSGFQTGRCEEGNERLPNLPRGTRYVEVRLGGDNQGGNTNNALHDNIQLEVILR